MVAVYLKCGQGIQLAHAERVEPEAFPGVSRAGEAVPAIACCDGEDEAVARPLADAIAGYQVGQAKRRAGARAH